MPGGCLKKKKNKNKKNILPIAYCLSLISVLPLLGYFVEDGDTAMQAASKADAPASATSPGKGLWVCMYTSFDTHVAI